MDLRFNAIAKSYESALAKYPTARKDADWLLDKLELKDTDRVLEFTAGSGFLTGKLLPLLSRGHLVSQDIADFMLDYNRVKNAASHNIWFYLEADPKWPALADESFDKSVCLGGFHHVQNQAEIMSTVCKKLKKGGVACVGDFADASPVQAYFDETIHKLTDTGHIGIFLSTSVMENLGRAAGFSSCETVRFQVPFVFDTLEAVGEFYKLVHCLNQDPSDTVSDVRRYMGIHKIDGKWMVPMDYVYAKYTK